MLFQSLKIRRGSIPYEFRFEGPELLPLPAGNHLPFVYAELSNQAAFPTQIANIADLLHVKESLKEFRTDEG